MTFSLHHFIFEMNLLLQVAFIGKGAFGHIENNQTGVFSVQCFSLASILKAMNKTVIDYLSLDVEALS